MYQVEYDENEDQVAEGDSVRLFAHFDELEEAVGFFESQRILDHNPEMRLHEDEELTPVANITIAEDTAYETFAQLKEHLADLILDYDEEENKAYADQFRDAPSPQELAELICTHEEIAPMVWLIEAVCHDLYSEWGQFSSEQHLGDQQ